MECAERYAECIDYEFDVLLLKIRNGSIKCGKYANLVKINKNKVIKGKELFSNGKSNQSKL